MKKSMIAVASFLVVSGLAMAQEPAKAGAGCKEGKHGKGPHPSPEQVIKKLDTNQDGSLSLEEFKASKRAQENPEKAAEHFAKIDSNSDGSVTLEELVAARKAHEGDCKGKPGKGGEGKGKHGKGGKGDEGKGGAEKETETEGKEAEG